MPASVTPLTPRRTGGQAAREDLPARRPVWDNTRLILLAIVVLASALAALITVASRSAVSPDVLTEVVLYALLAADLTMLAALLFLLARHIVKLVVERRRGRPFASLRGKLVALLLGMTVVPALLVLGVGSEIIRTNMDRWFNAPMDDILTSANQIATDYHKERHARVAQHAERVARSLARVDLTGPDQRALRDLLLSDQALPHEVTVQVYRASSVADGQSPVDLVFDVAGDILPGGYSRAVADRLAAETLSGASETKVVEPAGSQGDLLHAAALIPGRTGQPAGVVVATELLSGDIAVRARRMTVAFSDYSQLRGLKRPLTGVYLSFFLMVTLMILVGALWMGLYLAKRITRPVQLLAAAAREIGAGHLDQRIEPDSDDEFGALTEEFNAMAGQLARSRRDVDQSTEELERRHLEVEQRRRYVEAILERIATGVVSFDAVGVVTTINGSAARLLRLNRDVVGLPVRAVFGRGDLQPLAKLVAGAGRLKTEPASQEVALVGDGRELHLAAAVTPLVGEQGVPEGGVLVLDDVTPLIRTQKVAAWREVARRLAHEIKNPLTPIQLSAERLRRNFAGGPTGAQALVDECTGTIIGEVESLKGLVDEFSQFARMPAPRTVPTDLHRLILDTLALYHGLFADVRIGQAFDADVPLVRLDPEQIRRVIINLVDNAVEAMERSGQIVVETARDATNNVVRVVVADDGPGIPQAEREKLFLPYYSTKRRGSGLGLAIVRRIIAEHGGSIDVGDNHPRGTRFTIELPC
jgi:two-component system, NtrC family, nitrogen regulation sensor histidine kinase NtrY